MWWLWLLIAIGLLAGELLTSGFFLFWFAIGAAAACLASLFVTSFPVQLAIFILISAALLFSSRLLVERMDKTRPDTNINALLGQQGIITLAVEPFRTGVVRIGGEEWSCRSQQAIGVGGVVIVESVQGVTLNVRPLQAEKEE
ncbi:MAG: NfeD family protein [Firmicutes bacterium]|nr:NfeD family protein [Bacillota bacterium]